jgi:sugar/nucleoside kinase (ribokinase family)
MERRQPVFVTGNVYVDLPAHGFPPGGPTPHEPWRGDSYKEIPGGSAVTFARTLASLGVPTSLFGKIGNDMFGKRLQNLLATHENLSPVLMTSPNAQTSFGFHPITTDGVEYRMNAGNANETLQPVEIYNEIKEKDEVSYFYSGGVLKQLQLLPTLQYLFSLIQSHGIKVVLDHGNVPPDLTDTQKEQLRNAVQYVDVYLPSRNEFLDIWDAQSIEEGIEKVRETAPLTTIVIKDGKNGVIGAKPGTDSSEEEIIHIGAFDVPVVHTVGAGDSFNAGFVYGLTQGWSFEECLKFASGTSAWRISKIGANPPTLKQVLEIMNSYGTVPLQA